MFAKRVEDETLSLIRRIHIQDKINILTDYGNPFTFQLNPIIVILENGNANFYEYQEASKEYVKFKQLNAEDQYITHIVGIDSSTFITVYAIDEYSIYKEEKDKQKKGFQIWRDFQKVGFVPTLHQPDDLKFINGKLFYINHGEEKKGSDTIWTNSVYVYSSPGKSDPELLQIIEFEDFNTYKVEPLSFQEDTIVFRKESSIVSTLEDQLAVYKFNTGDLNRSSSGGGGAYVPVGIINIGKDFTVPGKRRHITKFDIVADNKLVVSYAEYIERFTEVYRITFARGKKLLKSIKTFKGSAYVKKYGTDCFGLDVKGNTVVCYSPENGIYIPYNNFPIYSSITILSDDMFVNGERELYKRGNWGYKMIQKLPGGTIHSIPSKPTDRKVIFEKLRANIPISPYLVNIIAKFF